MAMCSSLISGSSFTEESLDVDESEESDESDEFAPLDEEELSCTLLDVSLAELENEPSIDEEEAVDESPPWQAGNAIVTPKLSASNMPKSRLHFCFIMFSFVGIIFS